MRIRIDELEKLLEKAQEVKLSLLDETNNILDIRQKTGVIEVKLESCYGECENFKVGTFVTI